MSTDAPRRVLVVVPTLNETRHIGEVIETLCRDLPQDVDVSLVVADGGSTDGTVELVQHLTSVHPQLELMHNPRRIQSAAVNLAARRLGAKADVLIRCDAHASYPPRFIENLLRTMDDTSADAVVVPMDSIGDDCLQRAVAWVSDTPLGSGGSAHRGGQTSGFVDHGHHAAFRMSSFRRAGGYDETFTHNEDAELDCRQRGLGGRIYLDAGIRLAYKPRSNLRALAKQYFGYGRGRSRTVRRHPSSLRARQLAVPLHVAICAFSLVLAAWWAPLLAWPVLYLLMLAVGSIGIAIQRRSLCGLLSGPAAGVMHISWALGFFSGLLFTRESRWAPPPRLPAAS